MGNPARSIGRGARRISRWIDLLSAVMMASATVATAWSAYQSAVWNSQEATHRSQSTVAIIRVGKLNNLALQRTSVHVNLFVHWVGEPRRAERAKQTLPTSQGLVPRITGDQGRALDWLTAALAESAAQKQGTPSRSIAHSDWTTSSPGQNGNNHGTRITAHAKRSIKPLAEVRRKVLRALRT